MVEGIHSADGVLRIVNEAVNLADDIGPEAGDDINDIHEILGWVNRPRHYLKRSWELMNHARISMLRRQKQNTDKAVAHNADNIRMHNERTALRQGQMIDFSKTKPTKTKAWGGTNNGQFMLRNE